MSGIRRPEDILRERLGDVPILGQIQPRPVLSSDIELLIKEIQMLKTEIIKIKAALKKHGIDVE
ncbi:MAG: hypothetical protein LZ158_02065 [Thaumarchaeota archaeon]|jgi:hypothetical protein|nr:hypothetical protein [Candidatus Terraquivivens yellowstonensis]MCL7387241.1 hypothetical protein [Candidatus Terraquivivens yellowstonensis]MCL7392921.1 hypothetical protein [Candidatus Terraquivivens yellowstonensis]MCL7394784.1 hypothetical protein [Candidatus Terraquivivens yellowstonensis]MCL7397666.1 hypothetical protein [Candidatus Terraquivivens yellowstonensis]